MKKCLLLLQLCLLAASARAAVHVFVQQTNGAAWLMYECTAGEIVRAFALNVSVNQGLIIGISDFHAGPSTSAARGYGFFPAAFRDHISVVPGTDVTWNVSGYTPLAVVADSPADTLPGLNSSGVTLEFGGLWDPTVPAAVPDAAGILCSLRISQPANVSVAANISRGGVVSTSFDKSIMPVFSGAFVDPEVAITSATLVGGSISITFKGGELESAPAITGPWAGTGNTSGSFTEPIGAASLKFYRVRGR